MVVDLEGLEPPSICVQGSRSPLELQARMFGQGGRLRTCDLRIPSAADNHSPTPCHRRADTQSACGSRRRLGVWSRHYWLPRKCGDKEWQDVHIPHVVLTGIRRDALPMMICDLASMADMRVLLLLQANQCYTCACCIGSATPVHSSYRKEPPC